MDEKKETGVTVAAASRFRKKFSGEFISTEFSVDVLKDCTAEEALREFVMMSRKFYLGINDNRR